MAIEFASNKWKSQKLNKTDKRTLTTSRFTFTVKKFLETPLRDYCGDLKGTPRGFQKRIFKKNP